MGVRRLPRCSMKTVKITEILDYYDGILAFSAQDPIGGHYVGSLIEKTRDSVGYLVVGAKPEQLDDLRNGKIDLSTLLLETPSGEWYITTPEGTIDDPLTLEPQQTPLAETDYLPEAGYFLDDEPPDVAPAIQRALELGKVVAVAGQVEQVNRSAGEWGLLTEQGVKTGKVAPGGPNLDGLQVGKHYHFNCAEVTELDALWRDRKTLYLQSIEIA